MLEMREKIYDTGEIRLHYLEGPQAGPAMLLLHGATGSAREWSSVIDHLCQSWHVLAVDLRGHGLSGKPQSLEGYHILHHVQDTLAFLGGVVREPTVLVGHSYGAITALLSGKDGKEWVRAMVLEDPPLMLRRPNLEAKTYQDYFSWVYQMRQTATTLDEVLAQLAQQNPQVAPSSLRAWAQNLTWLDPSFTYAITSGDRRQTMKGVDFADYIQGIACPVLLMQADMAKNAALHPEDADFFLAHARDVQLVQFPGSGHGIHTGQTEVFLSALDAFTSRLPAIPR